MFKMDLKFSLILSLALAGCSPANFTGGGPIDGKAKDVPQTPVVVVNTRNCDKHMSNFGVYSGKKELRSSNLILSVMTIKKSNGDLIAAANNDGILKPLTKSKFQNGNTRFAEMEQSDIQFQLPEEKFKALEAKAEKDSSLRLAMAVFDDANGNGTIDKSDRVVSTSYGRPQRTANDTTFSRGLRSAAQKTQYKFQLLTSLYSDTNEGCFGDEGDVCEEKCDRTDDPLVVDLDGLGFQVSNLEDGVEFDITASGMKHKMAWTTQNSRNAFLFVDRNGNQTVDDGSELFSNASPLPGGLLASNGFEALIALDSNYDGVLDRRDPLFGEVGLWRDKNHNGISENGETTPLRSQVRSIDLNFTVTRETIGDGSQIFGLSKVTLVNGETRDIADLWFAAEK